MSGNQSERLAGLFDNHICSWCASVLLIKISTPLCRVVSQTTFLTRCFKEPPVSSLSLLLIRGVVIPLIVTIIDIMKGLVTCHVYSSSDQASGTLK